MQRCAARDAADWREANGNWCGRKLQEYQEVNAHLRANTSQFVNWFSFFLTLSLLMAGVFAATPEYRPALGRFAQHYGVQLVSLLMHIPVFVGLHYRRPPEGRSHNPSAWLF